MGDATAAPLPAKATIAAAEGPPAGPAAGRGCHRWRPSLHADGGRQAAGGVALKWMGMAAFPSLHPSHALHDLPFPIVVDVNGGRGVRHLADSVVNPAARHAPIARSKRRALVNRHVPHRPPLATAVAARRASGIEPTRPPKRGPPLPRQVEGEMGWSADVVRRGRSRGRGRRSDGERRAWGGRRAWGAHQRPSAARVDSTSATGFPAEKDDAKRRWRAWGGGGGGRWGGGGNGRGHGGPSWRSSVALPRGGRDAAEAQRVRSLVDPFFFARSLVARPLGSPKGRLQPKISQEPPSLARASRRAPRLSHMYVKARRSSRVQTAHVRPLPARPTQSRGCHSRDGIPPPQRQRAV